MAHHYIATASRPSAVHASLVGNFLKSDALCLLVAKLTHFELFTIGAEGLKAFMDVPVYGRIAHIEFFRPKKESKDLLFFSTECMQFCVLAFDEEKHEMVTRAKGSLATRVGKPCETGQLGAIDPEGRFIVLRLYEGQLKVIPVAPSGKLQDAFDVRLEEQMVHDMKFLFGAGAPTLAVLYKELDGQVRNVKYYEVSLTDKELVQSPIRHTSVDLEAEMLVPVPLAVPGLLVLGQNCITLALRDSRATTTIALNRTKITCCGRLDPDGRRHLLVDHRGELSLLLIDQTGGTPHLTLEALGRTTVGSTLSYVDEGVVFIGSVYGDSQLVRLTTERQPNGALFEVLDTYSNLGPILDVCVITGDHGHSQVVTCSGAGVCGSLRVVRNGIGVHQQAVLDMAGVRGLWALAPSLGAQHTVLALSFVGQTGFLTLGGEALEGVEVPGASAAESLVLATVVDNQWLQITHEAVRLIDTASRQLLAEWKPPSGTIGVAASNAHQAAVAVGAQLFYLALARGAITLESSTTLPQEIACLDISPVVGDRSTLCLVGLWVDMSLRVLQLPSLAELHKETLSSDTIPRSALLVSWGSMACALCGLGDGALITFTLDPLTGKLTTSKRVQLGTQPLSLGVYSNGTTHSVLACCDRPAVIHAAGQKLLFSNVNAGELVRMTPINSASYPDSLAFVSREGLTIGQMDDLQRIQIDTIPLADLPFRIHHQPATKTLCLLTESYAETEDTPSACSVHLLDEQSFDIVDTYKLSPHELALSVLSTKFTEDDADYYCVGVCKVLPTEDEPRSGRLLVFRAVAGKLVLETETEIKGAPTALASLNGRLVASISSKVYVFQWRGVEGGRRQLIAECGSGGFVSAIGCATRVDDVLVGDMMRSISLLTYKPTSTTLDLTACDYRCLWITALAFVNDDHYAATDNIGNLNVWRRNTDGLHADDRTRLDAVAEYHMADSINVIRHGSLAMHDAERRASMLLGAVSGALYVVVPLSKFDFEFLHQVQERLQKHVHGVGGLEHGFFRARKSHDSLAHALEQSSLATIDGDLVERLLELPATVVAQIADGLEFLDKAGKPVQATGESLTRFVEDLARLH